MNTAACTHWVTDEVDFLRREIPLMNARVVELGCGKAAVARALLQRGLVSSVTAFEVDVVQHKANLDSAPLASLRFGLAGAEAIPLSDASSDVVIMLKSLHHVPLDHLDRALAEVGRVLVPGGWLYVSEPVYAGDYNDIVKLFHDEGEVRAAAYAALQRASHDGVLRWEREVVFDTPMHFRDFDHFVDRIMGITHSDIRLAPSVLSKARARFERFQTHDGVHFVRQMRVNIMRKECSPAPSALLDSRRPSKL